MKVVNSELSHLSKMHAKTPICFNFFNFHPVSSKFSMNIKHIIRTKRMFFVFGIATFWRENDVTNLAPKNKQLAIGNFMNLFDRRY